MNLTALVDEGKLAAYLSAHLEGGAGPVRAEKIQAGHSNETFRLSRGTERWILRRPPQGPLLPTAHDVLREYRVMSLLRDGGGVRVPTVIAACEDTAVIGAPFYLMDRVDGVVIRDKLPDWLAEDGRDDKARH